MKKEKLSVFENMAWNSIGSFVYLLSQWLLTFIVVRFSSDMENAGNLSLAISITNIFYSLAHFNIRPYLVSDLRGNYSSNQYSAFRIITCIFSMCSCMVYILFFEYTEKQMMCIFLYLIVRLGEAWVDLLHGFEQKKYRMDIGGISLFIRGILSVLSFTVVLYYTNDICWSIAAVGICTIGYIVIVDGKAAVQYADYRPKINQRCIWRMIKEFTPLTIGSLASSIGVTIPKQMLESRMGSEALGIYSTVATPAIIVRVAATYVFNPILTEIAKCYNENKRKFVKLVLKICGVLAVISFICIVGAKLLGEFGLVLLYGEKIEPYVYLFMPVIGYTCLNAFESFLWNLLIVMRQIKWLWIVNIIGVFICMLIMNPMIDYFGMAGVSYTLIIYSFSLIFMMFGIVLKDLFTEKNKE